jgi:hypothetical protein
MFGSGPRHGDIPLRIFMVRTWVFSFQFVALLQRIRVFNPAREPGSLFGFALSVIQFGESAVTREPPIGARP